MVPYPGGIRKHERQRIKAKLILSEVCLHMFPVLLDYFRPFVKPLGLGGLCCYGLKREPKEHDSE